MLIYLFNPLYLALFSQEMFDIWVGERMNERVRADNQEDHSPAFVII